MEIKGIGVDEADWISREYSRVKCGRENEKELEGLLAAASLVLLP